MLEGPCLLFRFGGCTSCGVTTGECAFCRWVDLFSLRVSDLYDCLGCARGVAQRYRVHLFFKVYILISTSRGRRRHNLLGQFAHHAGGPKSPGCRSVRMGHEPHSICRPDSGDCAPPMVGRFTRKSNAERPAVYPCAAHHCRQWFHICERDGCGACHDDC